MSTLPGPVPCSTLDSREAILDMLHMHKHPTHVQVQLLLKACHRPTPSTGKQRGHLGQGRGRCHSSLSGGGRTAQQSTVLLVLVLWGVHTAPYAGILRKEAPRGATSRICIVYSSIERERVLGIRYRGGYPGGGTCRLDRLSPLPEAPRPPFAHPSTACTSMDGQRACRYRP